MVCMASFRSSNGLILSHFDDIPLKLSTQIYFMMLFHFMQSKYENSKNILYDVITNDLYRIPYASAPSHNLNAA